MLQDVLNLIVVNESSLRPGFVDRNPLVEAHVSCCAAACPVSSLGRWLGAEAPRLPSPCAGQLHCQQPHPLPAATSCMSPPPNQLVLRYDDVNKVPEVSRAVEGALAILCCPAHEAAHEGPCMGAERAAMERACGGAALPHHRPPSPASSQPTSSLIRWSITPWSHAACCQTLRRTGPSCELALLPLGGGPGREEHAALGRHHAPPCLFIHACRSFALPPFVCSFIKVLMQRSLGPRVHWARAEILTEAERLVRCAC